MPSPYGGGNMYEYVGTMLRARVRFVDGTPTVGVPAWASPATQLYTYAASEVSSLPSMFASPVTAYVLLSCARSWRRPASTDMRRRVVGYVCEMEAPPLSEMKASPATDWSPGAAALLCPYAPVTPSVV